MTAVIKDKRLGLIYLVRTLSVCLLASTAIAVYFDSTRAAGFLLGLALSMAGSELMLRRLEWFRADMLRDYIPIICAVLLAELVAPSMTNFSARQVSLGVAAGLLATTLVLAAHRLGKTMRSLSARAALSDPMVVAFISLFALCAFVAIAKLFTALSSL